MTMIENAIDWLSLENPEQIESPGLIIDADRVKENIRQMIECVGGRDHVGRLRPHVKTHKMTEVVRLQRAAGITQFKAATLSEAEMVADVGPSDVLLAYQPVGPNVGRLVKLIDRYPETSFAAITDDLDALRVIRQSLADPNRPFRLFIDVDCGMHRTGIEWGPAMDRLREEIEASEGLRFAGLHVYDGHIHDPPFPTRKRAADAIIDRVLAYEREHPSPAIVGGGSPTFNVWASESNWQCSPGTPVFWDVGYGGDHPELPFSIAAALLTRVISKPGDDRLCVDLGYKSVASEMPLEKRVVFPELEDARLIGHSEEHLVMTTANADRYRVGDPLIAYPRHICPTVALHAFASVVRGGRATGEKWRVSARDRDGLTRGKAGAAAACRENAEAGNGAEAENGGQP